MGATIERSLYTGTSKRRFELWDKVKLQLKNGEIVNGDIIDLEDYAVTVDSEQGEIRICVEDIEECFSL